MYYTQTAFGSYTDLNIKMYIRLQMALDVVVVPAKAQLHAALSGFAETLTRYLAAHWPLSGHVVAGNVRLYLTT